METIKHLILWMNWVAFVFLSIIAIWFSYYIFVMKPYTCPYCRKKLPKWRWPKRWKELYWGGWTCSCCGRKVEVDIIGRPLKK
jgi:DNA-directed RNA polymerase subunit RPC12/RpoP